MASSRTTDRGGWHVLVSAMLLFAVLGCATSGPHAQVIPANDRTTRHDGPSTTEPDDETTEDIKLAGYVDDESSEPNVGPTETTDGEVPRTQDINSVPQAADTRPTQTADLAAGAVFVRDVIASIHSTFPLLEAAYQQNQIAAAEQTAAWGSFDTKLKASTESGPVGFYETYRNIAGISRPVYGGGEVFAGYRVGRGNFQPWYLERQTNAGGEFKAGVSVPLLRNREIDARRAAVWRANYERVRAEPEILAQLILFVRDGSVAYWQWVAAGGRYRIGRQALELAEQRNAQLERKIDVGDVDPPVLQDSLRAIAQREAKLIDLRRKLRQSAIKLSLFLRDPDGTPRVPEESALIEFPEPSESSVLQLDSDVAAALTRRPELTSLEALAQRINVDLAEARNDLLPTVDARILGSQDTGAPTSRRRAKSQFELEAGVFVEVPVQRRKARGKSQAARGKLVQVAAKRRFTEDKIRTEIQSTHAAIMAARERLGKARESKKLAEYMADVERRRFELGDSNLLAVVLREQYAIEAAEAEVDALLEYHSARAEYDAAMARDWPVGD